MGINAAGRSLVSLDLAQLPLAPVPLDPLGCPTHLDGQSQGPLKIFSRVTYEERK